MPIELTEADAGTRRTVRAGDTVTVRLAENPTTGYRWSADTDGVRLKTVDDRFEPAESARGAGGVRVLVLQAVSAGSVTLHLSNRRSWESGPAGEELAMELDVQPEQ